MGQLVTLEQVKRSLPNKRNLVTQESVDIINQSLTDPEFQGETLLQTASTYEGILKGARASIPEYLNAIRFCSYMVSNESNYTESYKKVFSNREFVAIRMNLPSKDVRYAELTSAASRYRRSKLVVDILTASQVPLDLMFTGQRYKAIGVLASIMENGKYDRDKINAAKELLAATKGAENVKIELDIGVKENSAMQQLDDQLIKMASRQKMLLETGHSTLEEIGSMKVVENCNVVEGEFTDV